MDMCLLTLVSLLYPARDIILDCSLVAVLAEACDRGRRTGAQAFHGGLEACSEELNAPWSAGRKNHHNDFATGADDGAQSDHSFTHVTSSAPGLAPTDNSQTRGLGPRLQRRHHRSAHQDAGQAAVFQNGLRGVELAMIFQHYQRHWRKR